MAELVSVGSAAGVAAGSGDVSQLHWAVSANGGLVSGDAVPLLSARGSALTPLGVGEATTSPGSATRTGAGILVTAELTDVCTSDTADFASVMADLASSTTALVSCSSA